MQTLIQYFWNTTQDFAVLTLSRLFQYRWCTDHPFEWQKLLKQGVVLSNIKILQVDDYRAHYNSNDINKNLGSFHSFSPQHDGYCLEAFPSWSQNGCHGSRYHAQARLSAWPVEEEHIFLLWLFLNGKKAFTKKLLVANFPLGSIDWNHVWFPYFTAGASGKASFQPL